jgi:hypothetical protein
MYRGENQMAFEDIYVLRDLWQDGNGGKFRNEYYFKCTNGTRDAQNLCEAMATYLTPAVKQFLSSEMAHVKYEAYSIGDTSDFYSLADPDNGERSGTAAAPFIALSLRIDRSDRAFRNGSKRYGRLNVSDASGDYFSGAVQALTDDLTDLLDSEINYNGVGWTLQIPRREKDQDGHYQIVDFNTPASVVVKPKITTQNSRKLGVGE